MKIAITAQQARPDAEVDPRFGRAAAFIIHDSETGESTVVDNSQSTQAAHGAGLQAAERVAKTGAKVVLTGRCGPKAWDALTAAGITIVEGQAGPIPDAISAYLAGTAT